ncbi:MAG: DsbA family protein [Pseudomonadota bacterium]
MPFSRLAAPIAASLAALLAACSGESSTPASENSGASAASSAAAGDMDIKDTDIVIGADDAPVTIIEYASITCGGCANFHATTFPELKEKYIDTGKVRFVFREFPVVPSGLADLSFAGSMLARCLGAQKGVDAYFAAIKGLMKTMHPLKDFEYIETPRQWLLDAAAEAGMDEAAFEACVQDTELFDQLKAQVEHGAETYDISGTPSFIINGQPRRMFTIEQFDEALAPLLSSE